MANRSKKNGSDGWRSLPAGVLKSAGYKSRTYRYGLLTGQGIGGAVLLAGIVLSLLGISGSIEWLVEAGDISSKVTNASPGIVIALIGAALVWHYKPNVSHETTFDRSSASPRSVAHWPSSDSSGGAYREVGPGVVRERVTYREEQRGMDRAPENRSMEGRIQHGGNFPYNKKS